MYDYNWMHLLNSFAYELSTIFYLIFKFFIYLGALVYALLFPSSLAPFRKLIEKL